MLMYRRIATDISILASIFGTRSNRLRSLAKHLGRNHFHIPVPLQVWDRSFIEVIKEIGK